ncbi:hypothetical protein [Paractinoplanes durhamensis]|uniref:hypothetical protein n=1 Tax=Paractinoplanes durhamensis TaxID=113563 RepID=UPI0036304C9B
MRSPLAAAVAAGAALALTVSAPAFAADPTGTVLHAGSPDAVAGSYLVVLKDGALPAPTSSPGTTAAASPGCSGTPSRATPPG